MSSSLVSRVQLLKMKMMLNNRDKRRVKSLSGRTESASALDIGNSNIVWFCSKSIQRKMT